MYPSAQPTSHDFLLPPSSFPLHLLLPFQRLRATPLANRTGSSNRALFALSSSSEADELSSSSSRSTLGRFRPCVPRVIGDDGVVFAVLVVAVGRNRAVTMDEFLVSLSFLALSLSFLGGMMAIFFNVFRGGGFWK